MEDAMAKLGATILPIASVILPMLANAVVGVIEGIANVVTAIQEWFAANKEISDFLGWLVGFLVSTVGAAISHFATMVGNSFGMLGDIISGVADFIGGVIDGIVDGLIVVTDAAASIPGPWQEAATDMRNSLIEMKNATTDWGASTVATTDAAMERQTASAAAGAAATPAAVASGLSAGAPAVTTAAGDMVAGIAPAMTGAKNAAVEVAEQTPREMADGLRGGQFDFKDAHDSLVDVSKNTLPRHKEIAKLESFLTGKAMKKGLADGRPGVRAEFEAWKEKAEERLWALKNKVPELAKASGMSYADALASKRKSVAAQAQYMAAGQMSSYKGFPEKSKLWGGAAGSAYAAGLAAKAGEITTAAKTALGGAKSIMFASSPPPDPRSPLHEIDKFAARTAQAYADAFGSQKGYLTNAVEGFLSGATSTPAWVPDFRTSFAPGSLGASVTVRHVVDDPSGSLTKIGTTPGEVASALARGLDATGLVSQLRHVAAMEG
jgi:hypothetical protein